MNIDELAEQYRIDRIGYIACNYTKEQEEAVYMAASKILAGKYKDIIDVQDTYETLNSRGNIYTIYKYKGDARSGLLDNGKNCNVLIPYFLKRMTENLLHELTHKIGFIKADDSFLLMNHDIREAGTEIVASSAMSVKNASYFVLPGIAGSFPDNANSGLLTFSLVNQLGLLVGNQSLEKSILQGHDYFKEAISEKYGERVYEELSSKISSIEKEKERFYDLYSTLGEDNRKVAELGSSFSEQIADFQDEILKLEFDARYNRISSLDEGKQFLQDLNSFGKNRLQVQNSDGNFEDKSLEEIFNSYKSRIEQTYGTTGIEFERFKLEELPQLQIAEDLEPGEYLDIEQMAADFEKQSRQRLKESRKSGFRKWIDKFVQSRQSKRALPKPRETFDEDLYVKDFDGKVLDDYSDNKSMVQKTPDDKVK